MATDPAGHASTFYADTRSQIVRSLDPLGNARQDEYTPSSDVASSTDALGGVSRSTYDALGNLTRTQAPDVTGGAAGSGRSSTLAYPAQSGLGPYPGSAYQPASATDAQSNTTTYSYTPAGNLASATPPAGAGGQPARNRYQGDANGTGGTITCGGRPGQVCATVDGNDHTTGYSYDAAGQLTSRTDATGTTTYTYDPAGRPVGMTGPGGAGSQAGYDPAGNLTSVADAAGTVSYGYDAANRLTSLAEPGGNCGATPLRCTRFTVDANGARARVVFPNGVTQTLGYDSSGRQTSVAATKNGASGPLVSRAYRYTNTADADTALRTSVTDQAGVTTSYGYDTLNRLITATTGGSTLSYGYDPAGNRTAGPEGAHSYNNADQLTDPGYAHDAAGNTTADGGRGYTYTPLGQTASVTTGGTTLPMTYAGTDSTRRTQAGATSYANTLLGLTAQTTAGATTSFIRDPAGTLIAMRAGGASSYYTLDALGSVIALTDSTGNLAAGYTYDPYGTTLTATGPQATTNPYRYASGYTDPNGLVKFGTRYYNPASGRFTQPDPLGGGYPYAGDNPTNRTDPSGYVQLTPGGGGEAAGGAGAEGAVTGEFYLTPGGRPYTYHSLMRARERGIPGYAIDEAIDYGVPVKDLSSATVYYDATNNLTVVLSKTTGRVVTVRRGS